MKQFHQVGKSGEKVAGDYLKSIGYKILDSNYFNQRGYRIGEIDLIAEDKEGNIIFCEVKSRKGLRGEVVPGENMTQSKFHKIIKSANYFLAKNNLIGRNWRVDLIEVYFSPFEEEAEINHVEAVYF